MLDEHKLLLQRLAEDDKLLKALQEAMSEVIDTKPNLLLNDEQLGQTIRAREEAKRIVEEGIKSIKRLHITEKVDRNINNPGR